MISSKYALPATVLPLFIGAAVGTFLIYAMISLPSKWTYFFFGAAMGISVLIVLSVVTGYLKSVLLVLSVFSLAIPYNINFYFREYMPFFVTANGITISLFDLFFLPLVAYWVTGLFFRREISSSQTFRLEKTSTVLLLALAGINLISSTLAPVPFYSFSMLYWNLLVLVIYVYLANNLRSEVSVRIIGYTVIAALMTQGMIVLEQRFLGIIFTPENLGRETSIITPIGNLFLERFAGTLVHPNDLAIFLNLLLPLAFFLFLQEKRFSLRLYIGSGIALATLAEIWTASRGGWLSLAVALFITTILWVRKRGVGLIKVTSLSLLIFGLIFTVFFVLSTTFRERLIHGDYGSALLRYPLMEVAKNMILENPWIGVGLNNYAYSMELYDRTALMVASFYPFPVHNTYLLIAAETGIPALLLVSSLLMLFLWRGYQVFKYSTGIIEATALGLMGGLIAWSIHNLVNLDAFFMNRTLWFLFGVLAGLHRHYRRGTIVGRLPH